MPRGFGRVECTRACKCDNPNISKVHSRKIKTGRRVGQILYTYRCHNCKALWESMKKPEKVLK